MKKYICIEGIIGSGKTTLAQQIHQHFQTHSIHTRLLLERFEENKLLELFYQYPDKYKVLTEYSFLIDRFHQIYQHFQKVDNGITISDFCFRKCLWFAKNNLNHQQFQEFAKHYYQLEEDLNQSPDKIIFLDVKPELAFHNIQKRNRQIEKNITLNYLKNLYHTYIKHIENIDIAIVNIQVNSYDRLMERVLQSIFDD